MAESSALLISAMKVNRNLCARDVLEDVKGATG
jgi:hypothetical protein